MSPLRILIAAERIWPLADAEALAVEQIAHGLAGRDHAVTVLTRRWHKYWPSRLRIGDVQVERLEYCSPTRLGRGRLTRAVRAWLEQRASGFDLLVAAPLGELAGPVAMFAEQREMPLCLWQTTATDWTEWNAEIGRWRRTWPVHKAPHHWSLVHRAYADGLRTVTAQEEPITIWEPGIALRTPNVNRTVCRAALAEHHPELAIAPNEPLVLAVGAWRAASSAVEIVEAWRWVCQPYRLSKLWLIGEGPELPRAVEHARQRQMDHQVIAAGWFDDWSDLIDAADLFVAADPSLAPSYPMLAALRSGLPVVLPIADPSQRQWMRDAEIGIEYAPGNPQALGRRIAETLADPSRRAAVAARGRTAVAAYHDLDDSLEQFERTAHELVGRRERVRT
jgi:glycosyltransferase involved in cell wall biosynthesis